MKKRSTGRSGSTDSNDYSLYNEDRIKIPVRGGHSDSSGLCMVTRILLLQLCHMQQLGKQTSVPPPATSGLTDGIHCIDTIPHTVNQSMQYSLYIPSGRSITAHT